LEPRLELATPGGSFSSFILHPSSVYNPLTPVGSLIKRRSGALPSPRFERLDPEKRSALMEAARAEFAEHGFEASSYNRIIANSGVSKGSFYYYFHGKEDLYLTVVRDAVARFSQAVGDPNGVSTVEEFWLECARLYRRLFEFGLQNPTLVGVLKSIIDLRPGQMADDMIRQMMVKDVEWYRAMIRRGQEIGAVRTDLPLDLLLAFLFALFEAKGRWSLHQWLQFAPVDVEQNVRIMIDVFRRVATPTPQQKSAVP
jgi:AcrR family transcriptional regulator